MAGDAPISVLLRQKRAAGEPRIPDRKPAETGWWSYANTDVCDKGSLRVN